VSLFSYLALAFRNVIKKHREIWPAGINGPAIAKFGAPRRTTIASAAFPVLERAAGLSRKMSLTSSSPAVPLLRGTFFGGAPVETPYLATDGPVLVIDGLPLPLYECLEQISNMDNAVSLIESCGSVSEVTKLKQCYERGMLVGWLVRVRFCLLLLCCSHVFVARRITGSTKRQLQAFDHGCD
jgi:hypothetical protein